MKRLAVCIAIIAAIVAAGVFSIGLVSSKNERLYGMVRGVIETYEAGGDVSGRINELTDFFKEDYAPKLACVVNDGMLAEMAASASKLEAMYQSGCDEFTAECEALLTGADRILRSELPAAYRVM